MDAFPGLRSVIQEVKQHLVFFLAVIELPMAFSSFASAGTTAKGSPPHTRRIGAAGPVQLSLVCRLAEACLRVFQLRPGANTTRAE